MYNKYDLNEYKSILVILEMPITFTWQLVNYSYKQSVTMVFNP